MLLRSRVDPCVGGVFIGVSGWKEPKAKPSVCIAWFFWVPARILVTPTARANESVEARSSIPREILGSPGISEAGHINAVDLCVISTGSEIVVDLRPCLGSVLSCRPCRESLARVGGTSCVDSSYEDERFKKHLVLLLNRFPQTAI